MSDNSNSPSLSPTQETPQANKKKLAIIVSVVAVVALILVFAPLPFGGVLSGTWEIRRYSDTELNPVIHFSGKSFTITEHRRWSQPCPWGGHYSFASTALMPLQA